MENLSIRLKTEADLNSFQQSVNKLSAQVKPVNVKIATQLSTDVAELQTALGPVSSAIESTYKRLTAMRLEGSLSTESFDKLTSQVHDLQTSLEGGNLTFTQAQKSLSEITKEANGVETSLNGVAKSTDATKKGLFGMTQPLSDIISKFSTWYIVAGLVTSSINALKSVFSITMELDKQFTSLQMVTGYNNEQIKELRKEYIILAREMGTTVQTVATGADEWLRAGLSVAETNDALRASLVLSSIAQMDSAEATKYLVAAMNGFNLEASQLIGLVDKLSAVDIVAATSSQELGEALSYSATSAQLAGLGLDKYIGMIATVSETTRQSASTIGNSFRSIFTRMQAINTGALFDESGESISNVDSVLKNYGIDLMEVTQDMSDMGALLDLLGTKWDSYTNAQKSEIATTIAGNYQRERFLVLMENYERALELEKVALNSAGSAMDKYRIYQESLEANMNRLKSTWVDFVNSLQASGLIDYFLTGAEVLVGVISGFNNLIDSLGAAGDAIRILIPLIIAATAAWLAFKGVISGGAAIVTGTAAVIGAIGAIAILTESVGNYTKQQDVMSESIENSTESVDEYSESLNRLQSNLSGVSNALSKQIELLREEDKELEKQKDLQNKLLAVEKARQQLADAKSKRVRVFRAGVGFTYEADTSSVEAAQQNLVETLNELSEYKYDIALDRAESFVEQLNELLTNGDIVSGWQSLFDEFGDLLDTQFASYLLQAKKFVEEFGRISGIGGILMPNTDNIDHNASGSRNYHGGTTIVGENGPEIISLPQGSEILSNTRSMKLHDIVDHPSQYIKNTSNNSNIVFNGPLNFPNVKTASDAEGFINGIMQIKVKGPVSFG